MRYQPLPPRRPGDPWRIEEWLGLLLLPLSGLVLALAMRFGPVFGYHATCRFHAVSGLPCPGCGGVRAWQAVQAGDWALAWRLQPGVMAVGLLAIGFSVYSLCVMLAGLPRPRWQLSRIERFSLLALVLSAMLMNWGYLLLTAANR